MARKRITIPLKVDPPQHLVSLVAELPAHHLEAARVGI
jgi:hypothetical protein